MPLLFLESACAVSFEWSERTCAHTHACTQFQNAQVQGSDVVMHIYSVEETKGNLFACGNLCKTCTSLVGFAISRDWNVSRLSRLIRLSPGIPGTYRDWIYVVKIASWKLNWPVINWYRHRKITLFVPSLQTVNPTAPCHFNHAVSPCHGPTFLFQ